MKQKLIYLLAALLIIFALTLSACQSQPEAPAVEEPSAEEPVVEEPAAEEPVEAEPVEEEPAEPKIVTLAWTQEPDTLNIYYSNMWYANALSELYNCAAWQYDENNEPFASLATEIPTVSDDGLVITINLRDDIFWSDGTPITSDDFVFTHEMINSQNNAVDSVYPYDLFTIDAPDAQTVVMTFEAPFTPWLSQLWDFLLPKHVLQPEFDSAGNIDEADWNLAPSVSCGPFNFGEWESGSYIRFDRNDNYWGSSAKLDSVFFQFVPDDAAQTAATLAGDTDIAFWPPYEDIPSFQEAGLSIVTQASGYNEGWYFNMREMASPGAQDLVVRKAIAMALDRESNTDIRLGVVSPNETFFDAIPAYVSPDIVPWEFDPEGAKELLESNGYVDSDGDGIREDKEGNPLTITQGNTTKEERQNYQAVAQQQLLAVGIDLQIIAYDADILFGSYSDGGPAAVGELDIMEWSDAPAFPDPDTPYWLCSELATDEYPWGYNYFICDEALDALFQEQIEEVNGAARIELFYKITKHMHDNVYYLGIWDDPDVWIVSPQLTGYKFSGVSPFFNIAEWDFVP